MEHINGGSCGEYTVCAALQSDWCQLWITMITLGAADAAKKTLWGSNMIVSEQQAEVRGGERGRDLENLSCTCWWKHQRRAQTGQGGCNRRKVAHNQKLLHYACRDAIWLAGRQSQRQTNMITCYGMQSLSDLDQTDQPSWKTISHWFHSQLSARPCLVSEEFWSHWLIMERFNAAWMVNINRERTQGQTQSESESGVSLPNGNTSFKFILPTSAMWESEIFLTKCSGILSCINIQ